MSKLRNKLVLRYLYRRLRHSISESVVRETTETDVANLTEDKKFECGKCGMTYPTKHGLSVHQGRWCKGRRTAKKPSRKGIVADKLIQRLKVDKVQENYEKIKIGGEELEMNSPSFIWELKCQLMEILLFLSNFVVILRDVISGNTVKS